MRKAAGIALASDGSFVVVCEDGSVWTFASNRWQQIAPPLPEKLL